MDPTEAAIVEAGMTLIEMVVNRIKEAKEASDQRKAEILANFQNSQTSLTSAQADANAELDKIKKS